MRARVLLAGLCLLVTGAAQPSGRGVIAGTVVESTSGEPVRKAIVTVTWHGTPRSWATTRTGGDGRFRFEGLPAGVYDLRANKAELGSANYGTNSTRESGETITLADGETRDGLKLRFFHSASISGRVFGPDGDAIRGLQVQLLRTTRNLGERTLAPYRQVQADDHGEYQITNVEPGQYFLYASQMNRGFQVMDDPAAQEILVGQFLGGVRESKNATMLNLHDGDVLKGLDFRLTSERAIMVSGHIEGLPAPPPAPPEKAPVPQPGIRGQINGVIRGRMAGPVVQISMAPISEFAAPFMFRGNGSAGGPDYKFKLQPEPPGRYRIEASSQIEGKNYTAFEIIDVQPGMGEINLTLSPPVEIRGHLRIEGDAGKTKINVNFARPVGIPGGNNQNFRLAEDGSFTMESVAPGDVSLNINPLPRDGYLKSARFGDEDVRFKRFAIHSGPQPALEIVISTHSGKITGTVDANGGDPARAGIILEPVGELHDLARFYYGVVADEHGKFQFLSISPGKYRIFAVEKLAPAGFRNVEGAEQLEQLADTDAPAFELAEGANLELKPKLIPFERARVVLQ